jgi:hypothetical protein
MDVLIQLPLTFPTMETKNHHDFNLANPVPNSLLHPNLPGMLHTLHLLRVNANS